MTDRDRTTAVRLLEHDPAWAAHAERERQRVYAALGACTEGGVLWGLEHVGSSSIAGVPAQARLDGIALDLIALDLIALDLIAKVHPLDLPEERARALSALGYQPLEGAHAHHRHGYHRVLGDGLEARLYLVGHETSHWADAVLLRNYLRAHAASRAAFAAQKRHLAERFVDRPDAFEQAKGDLLRALLPEAHAWHVAATGFAPVERVATDFATMACPWMIASGWAIDLYLDTPSRYHDDIDVVIFREDQLELQRQLREHGWDAYRVVKGGYAPWRDGETLEHTTIQVHAFKGGLLEGGSLEDRQFLDCLISPRQGDLWAYRRQPDITMPLRQAMVRSKQGIPILAPEAVLLFKSRNTAAEAKGAKGANDANEGADLRGKDHGDFERVLAALPAARKAWLREALRATRPEHAWLALL